MIYLFAVPYLCFLMWGIYYSAAERNVAYTENDFSASLVLDYGKRFPIKTRNTYIGKKWNAEINLGKCSELGELLEGVADRHVLISLDCNHTYYIEAASESPVYLAMANGANRVLTKNDERVRLDHGTIIQIGAIKMRFRKGE